MLGQALVILAYFYLYYFTGSPAIITLNLEYEAQLLSDIKANTMQLNILRELASSLILSIDNNVLAYPDIAMQFDEESYYNFCVKARLDGYLDHIIYTENVIKNLEARFIKLNESLLKYAYYEFTMFLNYCFIIITSY